LDDGYLSLVGRIKELINRGGAKMAPRDIGELLLAHDVAREAVTSGTDAEYGERVEAALTLGEPVTGNDQRCAPFAEGLADGGIEPRVVKDIRAQAWLKLMGDAVTSAVIELARLAGVDVPRLQTLHAATDLMARKHGAR
jgi:acyl-CoA synthetase (AMP-forming)/AMP-acid ligase II